VTYANDKRCLETTRRLRDSYPAAPILVRARTALEAESLLQAGATEVVVEALESAVRFASLLGAEVAATDSLLRVPLNPAGDGVASVGAAQQSGLPPYPKEELESLAADCGITLTQVCSLYDGFSLLEPNAEGEVELGAIRNMLASVGVPIEDDKLTAWMAEADRDGSNALSFFEYVRVDTQLSATSDERGPH